MPIARRPDYNGGVNIQSLLGFYSRAATLKSLHRAGWRRCGIPAEDCESVADHSFGVALLSLLVPTLAPQGIDRDRCVALALVHDLAESIVGDITPHDGVEAAEKHTREERAMRELADTLGDESVLSLWLEFEEAQTPEAKLVRDLDLIDMALQAKRYESDASLTSEQSAAFIESAQRRMTTTTGHKLLTALLALKAHG